MPRKRARGYARRRGTASAVRKRYRAPPRQRRVARRRVRRRTYTRRRRLAVPRTRPRGTITGGAPFPTTLRCRFREREAHYPTGQGFRWNHTVRVNDLYDMHGTDDNDQPAGYQKLMNANMYQHGRVMACKAQVSVLNRTEVNATLAERYRRMVVYVFMSTNGDPIAISNETIATNNPAYVAHFEVPPDNKTRRRGYYFNLSKWWNKLVAGWQEDNLPKKYTDNYDGKSTTFGYVSSPDYAMILHFAVYFPDLETWSPAYQLTVDLTFYTTLYDISSATLQDEDNHA